MKSVLALLIHVDVSLVKTIEANNKRPRFPGAFFLLNFNRLWLEFLWDLPLNSDD